MPHHNCPDCGSESVSRCLFGFPDNHDAPARQAQADENTVGSCCIGSGEPVWRCDNCGHCWA